MWKHAAFRTRKRSDISLGPKVWHYSIRVHVFLSLPKFEALLAIDPANLKTCGAICEHNRGSIVPALPSEISTGNTQQEFTSRVYCYRCCHHQKQKQDSRSLSTCVRGKIDKQISTCTFFSDLLTLSEKHKIRRNQLRIPAQNTSPKIPHPNTLEMLIRGARQYGLFYQERWEADNL